MKEKYITKRMGKFPSYKVCYKGISKTFSERDYGDKALKTAIKFRNKLMTEEFIQLDRIILVEDCFEEVKTFYNLRAETVRKYDCLYKKYIANYGRIMINRLKKADIIDCLNSMVKDATDGTIQRVFTIWKKLVYMANAREYIDKDITFGIMPPKSHKIRQIRAVNRLDDKLLGKIVSCLHDHIQGIYDREMFPLIVQTLYFTGMRPCECLALNKADVKDGVIHITKELGSDRIDQSVIRTCKTEDSVRTIPIVEELHPVIDRLMQYEGELLFPNKGGRHYNVTNVGDRIHKCCASHGINIRLYDFRHNFSTVLLQNGANPRTHQELMGHKNYTMSVNYATSSNEEKKATLETSFCQKSCQN